MFGLFRSKPSNKFYVMGHKVEVVLVTRGGDALFTGSIINSYPIGHHEGRILEVMLKSRSGLPYFVYYLCQDYYQAVALPGSSGAFGGPLRTEEFRTAVSQRLGQFVAEYIIKEKRIDVRGDIVGFRHNRANTNVLAYVLTVDQWHAIQHNDSEDERAARNKVISIMIGGRSVKDFVAINDISPSG